MKKYILIETSLLKAQMRAKLSNFRKDKSGYFLQDGSDTLVEIGLNDPPPTTYYILSWKGTKPIEVPARYTENGDNPKTNKIFTADELVLYLSNNQQI